MGISSSAILSLMGPSGAHINSKRLVASKDSAVHCGASTIPFPGQALVRAEAATISPSNHSLSSFPGGREKVGNCSLSISHPPFPHLLILENESGFCSLSPVRGLSLNPFQPAGMDAWKAVTCCSRTQFILYTWYFDTLH